jgi:hypothetical protein
MSRLIVITFFIAITCGVADFGHSAAQNQVVSDEWVTVHVCHVSFLIPKDLKRTDTQGVDSCVAEFTNEKIKLYLDYGHYTSPKEKSSRDFDFKEQSIMVGGKTARVATYNDDTTYSGGEKPYLRYFAHMYVIVKPGEGEPELLPISLMMNVGGKSENVQEIAQRIFRSVSFDDQNTPNMSLERSAGSVFRNLID